MPNPPITPETLAALDAAGYAVVPAVPTSAMRREGNLEAAEMQDAGVIFGAMVEAGRLRPSALPPWRPAMSDDRTPADDRVERLLEEAEASYREAVYCAARARARVDMAEEILERLRAIAEEKTDG